ncbi:MAG: hypothetical protein K8S55_07475 [Phycisphaerae bacterium]|nr:hypothetical protein [Phycisphaerae bacterium]
MKKIKLDKEEKQILRDFERGKLKPITNSQKEKKELEAAARRTLLKDK